MEAFKLDLKYGLNDVVNVELTEAEVHTVNNFYTQGDTYVISTNRSTNKVLAKIDSDEDLKCGYIEHHLETNVETGAENQYYGFYSIEDDEVFPLFDHKETIHQIKFIPVEA